MSVLLVDLDANLRQKQDIYNTCLPPEKFYTFSPAGVNPPYKPASFHTPPVRKEAGEISPGRRRIHDFPKPSRSRRRRRNRHVEHRPATPAPQKTKP
jgi:hypothetical protein